MSRTLDTLLRPSLLAMAIALSAPLASSPLIAAEQLEQSWFNLDSKIGVTAGASAPEILIKQVIQRLQDWGATAPTELQGCEENITFSLPKGLRIQVTQA